MHVMDLLKKYHVNSLYDCIICVFYRFKSLGCYNVHIEDVEGVRNEVFQPFQSHLKDVSADRPGLGILPLKQFSKF